MFTLLWICWILAFAVIETVALVDDAHHARASGGRTLSYHLRHWFHTDTHLGRTVWMIVSALFFGWFLLHIAAPGLVPPF